MNECAVFLLCLKRPKLALGAVSNRTLEQSVVSKIWKSAGY